MTTPSTAVSDYELDLPHDELSPAQQLSLSGPELAEQFFNNLTEQEIRALPYLWEFWARPKQLAPPGDWTYLLWLAGRGFGKSRAIVEWAIEKARAMPGSRGAVVAATAADLRDILVEGESGFMACSPPDFMPHYEPSKSRLTWPNGTTAALRSAETPDRLRGPQFHWAIADEICLVAGTMIATAQGDVPIEQVKPGVLVHTRNGLRPVTKAWKTTDTAVVYKLTLSDGRELTGTASHPVFVEEKGFVALSEMQHGDIIVSWDIIKQSQITKVTTRRKGSGGAGSIGTSTRMLAGTTSTAKANCCTEKNTRLITAKSRRGWTSIMWMDVGQITILPISRHLPGTSILPNTHREALWHSAQRGGAATPNLIGKQNNLPKSFVLAVLRRFCLPVNAPDSAQITARPASIAARGGTLNIGHVVTAVRNLWSQANTAVQVFVPGRVCRLLAQSPNGESARPASVLSATPSSLPKTQEHKPARANAAMPCGRACVVSVQRQSDPQPVYNLEVDGDHEYFANGILTHNCSWRFADAAWDMLQFGLRLGQHPQCAIATTPRPLPLLTGKEGYPYMGLLNDPACQVVTGTTYENRSNLAPNFFRSIITRYEGTRLGRQELLAGILSDVPGALWSRDVLETSRRFTLPTLVRIVVGVDPAASTGTTGIVVVGIALVGDQWHAYVIEDATAPAGASPGTWAGAAVAAYNKWGADAIVAESNNGGEMVRHTIRTVEGGDKVNIKLVHASRGKHPRAEPVSSIFERKQAHMVGLFGPLEDELCTWVPGEESPNRLDAMVWAITDLMLDGDEEKQAPATAEPMVVTAEEMFG